MGASATDLRVGLEELRLLSVGLCVREQALDRWTESRGSEDLDRGLQLVPIGRPSKGVQW